MINERTVTEPQHKRRDVNTEAPFDSPLILFIDPCGACNFTCSFCPCNTSEFMTKERHAVMSFGLFEKLLADLKQFPHMPNVINLYGFGEPLLHPRYCDMVRRVKSDIGSAVRCTTNGSLLGAEMNRSLIDAGIDMVRVSIEALSSEDYERICGVRLDFDVFVENIRDLFERSRGTNTRVSAKIINAALKNAEEAERFFDVFSDISDYHYIQDTTNAWPEFRGFVPSGGFVAGNIDLTGAAEKICSFCLTHMTIHSNGAVGSCPQDWKFAACYGNAAETPLTELWRSKKLQNIRIAHLSGRRKMLPYCCDCLCVSDDAITNREKLTERCRAISESSNKSERSEAK